MDLKAPAKLQHEQENGSIPLRKSILITERGAFAS